MISLKEFLECAEPNTRINKVYLARIVSPDETPTFKFHQSVHPCYTLGMLKSGARTDFHTLSNDDIIFKALKETHAYELELRQYNCRLAFESNLGIFPVIDLYVVERLFAPTHSDNPTPAQKKETTDGTDESSSD